MTTATAFLHETEAERGPARRILVAEDSPTTHEILKLLLQQRGHDVDIATDGEQALEALRHNRYDVALLDFHLPKMSGLEVAATIRHEAHDHPLPRLVAITADVKGLLADEQGCDNFDQILPKPLDIYHVAQVVEGQEEIAEAERLAPAPQPAVPRIAEERHSPLEDLGYNFLTWPGDIDTGRLSARAMQASLGDPRFDGILVKAPVSVEDLAAIWSAKALYMLPIVDLTGALGRIADVDASKLTALDKGQLDDVIRAAHDRRARLHRDLQFSTELGDQLIGKLYVSNRPLTPSYDPLVTWLVSYDVALTHASGCPRGRGAMRARAAAARVLRQVPRLPALRLASPACAGRMRSVPFLEPGGGAVSASLPLRLSGTRARVPARRPANLSKVPL